MCAQKLTVTTNPCTSAHSLCCLSLLPPQGHCFAPGAYILHILFSLSHTVSAHHFLFSSVAHFDSEKTIRLTQKNRVFLFLFPRCSPPCHPTHSSLSILHSSPLKLCFLIKGAPMLSQMTVEMGLCAIDTFHPRGEICQLCPGLFSPPQITPRPSTGSLL